jgi:Domain of unknown function (DUF4347)
MIGMKSPSFAFNAVDVPGPNYRMWRWMKGYTKLTAMTLVNSILQIDEEARESQGDRLQNIIINAHGDGGFVKIGGMGVAGLNKDTSIEFARLKGKNLGTIWLVACQAARGDYGKTFCSTLAKNSGCQVIASDEFQDVGFSGTWNLATWAMHDHIDEFEGTVYSFTPSGGVKIIDPHNDQGLVTVTDWEGRF